MTDANPRPLKRQRLSVLPSKLTPVNLLLKIPALLVHPPNHRHYAQSLHLSLIALRKCLSLDALTPDVECQAWTSLAEICMRIITGELHLDDAYPWAKDVENEVEHAISKALLISQKHASLRWHKHHVSLLQAQYSMTSNPKFARSILKRLTAPTYFSSADPPHIIYSSHLDLIAHYTTPPLTFAPALDAYIPSLSDLNSALQAIQTLYDISVHNGHPQVTLLATVLRLQVLFQSGTWADAAPALLAAESALGLSYECYSRGPKDQTSATAAETSCTPNIKTASSVEAFIHFTDQFEASMAVHVLVLGVLWHTHAGSSTAATARLAHLHVLMDEHSQGAGLSDDGIVEISFPCKTPPLRLQATHPRILFLLTFLVSSTAKRDAVGRKPKRRIFAVEGLKACETEVVKEIQVSPWALTTDVRTVEASTARIKADLISELIGISILRSEFDAAEQHLVELIAHTRTMDLWPSYAPLICLHQAHLAHALGQAARAAQCYEIAAVEAPEGSIVAVAAAAGEVALHIGLASKLDDASEHEREAGKKRGMEVVDMCRGMGGLLEAVGEVLEACLVDEIIKSKTHLKRALALASSAQDNHLRALVLALVAAHYIHTAPVHATEVLQTCEQLAAGLGALSKDSQNPGDLVGNAPLRLWVGERFLELYKREGKTTRAEKQTQANEQLARAIIRTAERGSHLRSVSTKRQRS